MRKQLDMFTATSSNENKMKKRHFKLDFWVRLNAGSCCLLTETPYEPEPEQENSPPHDSSPMFPLNQNAGLLYLQQQTHACLVSGVAAGTRGASLLGAKLETWGRGGFYKKLIGNRQTSPPPRLFYQRIFHKHIRDESPTCMMFSPPTSPSISAANCPGQSKRCTSKVSSQWRGFCFFISNRRAFLCSHTKCNAVGPSFISLRGEKPEQGTTESGFRIQVWKRAAVVWMRVYVLLCFKWALSVTQSRTRILGQLLKPRV